MDTYTKEASKLALYDHIEYKAKDIVNRTLRWKEDRKGTLLSTITEIQEAGPYLIITLTGSKRLKIASNQEVVIHPKAHESAPVQQLPTPKRFRGISLE